MRGYGATAARLTPDQKVGSSNLSALIFAMPASTALAELQHLPQAWLKLYVPLLRSCGLVAPTA